MTSTLKQLVMLAGLSAMAAPALAINCSKASTPVDKLVCSDKPLLAADAKLNRAYGALVKSISDAQLLQMAVTSQKRWLQARDKALAIISNPENAAGEQSPQEAMLQILQARTADLQGKRSGDVPRIIQTAQRQLAFQAKFGAGQYAGYETNCDFLPRDYTGYSCFGTRHYQNRDRICSVREDFATNAVTTDRYVAQVVGGKPKLIASCSFGGSDSACPSSVSPQGRWNTQPKADAMVYATGLPRIDGEIYDADDQEWLQSCLSGSLELGSTAGKQ